MHEIVVMVGLGDVGLLRAAKCLTLGQVDVLFSRETADGDDSKDQAETRQDCETDHFSFGQHLDVGLLDVVRVRH